MYYNIYLLDIFINIDNLVYRKFIWQIFEKYFFVKVVDGLYEISLGGWDQCVMFYLFLKEVMWMVDFEVLYSIYIVVLYYKFGGLRYGK